MRKGFSAHDLLMVLCIIGILWLVALPVIVHQMRVRAKERKVAQAIAAATAVAPTAEPSSDAWPTAELTALYDQYDACVGPAAKGRLLRTMSFNKAYTTLEQMLAIYEVEVARRDPVAVANEARREFWPRLINLDRYITTGPTLSREPVLRRYAGLLNRALVETKREVP